MNVNKPRIYVLKNTPIKGIDKIRFKWNSLEIKVQFYYINEITIKMGIGFFDRDNKRFPYENWISKDIVKKGETFVIIDSLIQHPPYKFYSKKIKSLYEIYDKFFLLSSNLDNKTDFKKKILITNEDDKIYYFCTAKSKNISIKNKEKIIRTCGIKFYEFLLKTG